MAKQQLVVILTTKRKGAILCMLVLYMTRLLIL
jgi:hypothetical protein